MQTSRNPEFKEKVAKIIQKSKEDTRGNLIVFEFTSEGVFVYDSARIRQPVLIGILVAKTKQSLFIDGNIAGRDIFALSGTEFPVSDESYHRLLVVNATHQDNVKVIGFDPKQDFGLEISNKSPLAEDDLLLLYIETAFDSLMLVSKKEELVPLFQTCMMVSSNKKARDCLRKIACLLLEPFLPQDAWSN